MSDASVSLVIEAAVSSSWEEDGTRVCDAVCVRCLGTYTERLDVFIDRITTSRPVYCLRCDTNADKSSGASVTEKGSKAVLVSMASRFFGLG